uniref:Uncharacterized protein n=1 Tax=viral metagenome TaxID=1070528 RepID=A0A6C0JLL9_9ZZZZ
MDNHWFDYVTLVLVFIFIYGLIYTEPIIFIQINFLVKVIIGLYLMYKFNDFNKHKTIEFTILDKKICFSAGLYLIVFSFADIINNYLNKIKMIVQNDVKK